MAYLSLFFFCIGIVFIYCLTTRFPMQTPNVELEAVGPNWTSKNIFPDGESNPGRGGESAKS